MDTKELEKVMNEVLQDMGISFQGPRYRYWENRKKDMYCYTTERVAGKFAALLYRYYKTKEKWVLVKKSLFSKMRIAKKYAYRWFIRENQDQFHPDLVKHILHENCERPWEAFHGPDGIVHYGRKGKRLTCKLT